MEFHTHTQWHLELEVFVFSSRCYYCLIKQKQENYFQFINKQTMLDVEYFEEICIIYLYFWVWLTKIEWTWQWFELVFEELYRVWIITCRVCGGTNSLLLDTKSPHIIDSFYFVVWYFGRSYTPLNPRTEFNEEDQEQLWKLFCWLW